MTSIEIKEHADCYVNRLYKQSNSTMNVDGLEEVIIKQAFQDGAEWMQEKLKCCGNCKYAVYSDGICIDCSYDERFQPSGRCKDRSNWELADE